MKSEYFVDLIFDMKTSKTNLIHVELTECGSC